MTQNRRTFLKQSAGAMAGAWLSALEAGAAAYHPHTHKKSGFGVKILATNWGFNGTLKEYCMQVKKEGYDGIEIWWPMRANEQEELFRLLKEYGLDVGFLVGAYQPHFQEHLLQFKAMADAAAHNKSQKPLYINCHSGKDFFSHEQNQGFIDHTRLLSERTGIPVFHETHRSRMLYAAPVGRQYLERNPDLKITLDASHWCTVSESLLEDQQDTMQLAIARTGHVHARIGHAQGPQVSDPRAPEWERAVKAHFAWWDAVADRKRASGEPLTILTEFGPPEYMPTLPYTRQPLADQWAINAYLMRLLRKRYLIA